MGVVTEEIIKTAQSLDAEKLKEAALKLSDKITTVTGKYQIDKTGSSSRTPSRSCRTSRSAHGPLLSGPRLLPGPELTW